MKNENVNGSVFYPLIDFLQQENWYHDICYKYGDPRSKDFFLVLTPGPVLSIVAAYLITVVVLSKVMHNRKGLKLRGLIFLYNIVLVALSAFMFYEFLSLALQSNYSFICEPVDWKYKRDALSLRMVNVSWLFFFSKIIELADTFFFILRKKTNQVTFLHVYHHSTMLMNWWMAAKYVPTGQSFFVGVVNSLIHTFMYAYYALACMGPRVQKLLWWKKYITSLQLIQFVLVVAHTGNALYITPCDYPFLYSFITFYYSWSMMVLFLNFYYNTYISRKSLKPTLSTTNENREIKKNETSLLLEAESKEENHVFDALKNHNGFITKNDSECVLNGLKDKKYFTDGVIYHRNLQNGISKK